MQNQLIVSLYLAATAAGMGATALHHYSFDEAAVTDSIGSANGSLLNGAYVAGGLLHLDGIDDYVQFGQMQIPTSGPFSVAFFARELTPTMTNRMEMISQSHLRAGLLHWLLR